MGRGGRVAGDNGSVNVPEGEDRKAEVSVVLRTSRREETLDAGHAARRGCVRKVVALVTAAGVD
jgi:hypothetical protein